ANLVKSGDCRREKLRLAGRQFAQSLAFAFRVDDCSRSTFDTADDRYPLAQRIPSPAFVVSRQIVNDFVEKRQERRFQGKVVPISIVDRGIENYQTMIVFRRFDD